jgi:hypothetical protein
LAPVSRFSIGVGAPPPWAPPDGMAEGAHGGEGRPRSLAADSAAGICQKETRCESDVVSASEGIVLEMGRVVRFLCRSQRPTSQWCIVARHGVWSKRSHGDVIGDVLPFGRTIPFGRVQERFALLCPAGKED